MESNKMESKDKLMGLKLQRLAMLLSLFILQYTTSLAAERYAAHSMLATGKWVKIRVAQTGPCMLSDELLQQAGFSDPSRVQVFGYGGALQPEGLLAAYLTLTDDLHEVGTVPVDGGRVFFATGPVNWEDASSTLRIRNPYSDYGYYFLTEATRDTTPLTITAREFLSETYPHPNDYHALYEVDNYYWFKGGRNLYDGQTFGTGVSRDYILQAPSAEGTLSVVMSYADNFEAQVLVNGSVAGTMKVNKDKNSNKSEPNGHPFPDEYSKAAADTWQMAVEGLTAETKVTIRQLSGGDIRLDLITLCCKQPKAAPDLSTTDNLQVAEIVGPVDNQDHHADGPADMIIIIPASRQLQGEAERLKQLHEDIDGLTVRIVPADELFNEFSSGTPDANAYRRYLKMLYDRAGSDDEKPRFLLLFGDGAWDNRMRLSDWSAMSPDDFLLCFESENSFSSTKSYVADDFFTMLDDGEGTSLLVNDTRDIAVGRLTARTADEARVMVDKIYSYVSNDYAGAWQNTICFMGDDGNKNMHMEGAEEVAQIIAKRCPTLQQKKIYWDAYQRTVAASGYSYPDVTRLILQQMDDGALVMNYTGHGGSANLSHEYVITRSDFERPTSLRLPLWFTASCDILPFDGHEANIGETAMLNSNGGAIAFFGTTRTVYADYNLPMNRAFTRQLLAIADDGRPNTIGEAVRLAKNELLKSTEKKDLTENKLHYTLLGDPALRLNMPLGTATIDQINGEPVSDDRPTQVVAGKTVTVRGSIPDHSGFNGQVTIAVYDAEQTITCRINNTSTGEKPSQAFVYNDRTSQLFRGSGPVVDGQFLINFCVPLDNSYADTPCRIYVYAVNDDKTVTVSGLADAFTITSEQMIGDNPQGPDISCTISSEGGQIVFYAEVYDDDGLNVSNSGIGHDMELIIDGQVSQTYNLNSAFQFDYGDYRGGHVTYALPAITSGEHQLLFRAWDVLNHSSVAEMTFSSSLSYAPTAIATVRNASNHAPAGMFDLQGRRLSTPPSGELPSARHGIVITRDSNGTVKKIMVGGQ